MYLDSQIAQLLHDEHQKTLDLINRLEERITGRRAKEVPGANDAAAVTLLADLHAELQATTGHHFNFEEDNIFPALSAIGDVAIPHILRQEHDLLRNLSEFMLPVVEKARADGFTAESWAEFCELALELVERQISHIQKEEMGLLPTLSGLFEDDRDGELVMLYAEAS